MNTQYTVMQVCCQVCNGSSNANREYSPKLRLRIYGFIFIENCITETSLKCIHFAILSSFARIRSKCSFR